MSQKKTHGPVMDQKMIIDFFNKCAPAWDAETERNEDVINRILDNGGIRKGVRVLDVACGTGVLFPDYLKRDVLHVTGIDISPEMIRIAREKFTDPRIDIICDDAVTREFDQKFDCVMIYNAFPHFPDPDELIRVMSEALRPGGRLSVAHGMSREKLAQHHSGAASKVSLGLPEAEALAEKFSPYLDVDICVSNDEMYQVSGILAE